MFWSVAIDRYFSRYALWNWKYSWATAALLVLSKRPLAQISDDCVKRVAFSFKQTCIVSLCWTILTLALVRLTLASGVYAPLTCCWAIATNHCLPRNGWVALLLSRRELDEVWWEDPLQKANQGVILKNQLSMQPTHFWTGCWRTSYQKTDTPSHLKIFDKMRFSFRVCFTTSGSMLTCIQFQIVFLGLWSLHMVQIKKSK